ncbi:MAG: aldehyde dehydrogenase family protein, partial [Kiritimatiellae bacterium]|nr:aldehyde dehydrogenase family protein [Kiritimatiellia bacterium]
MLDNVSSGPVIKGLYIDGQWQAAPGQFDDMNPSDGSVWARIPDAGAAETQRAIDAAHRAFPAWSSLRFQERAQLLLKMGEIWDKRSQDYV